MGARVPGGPTELQSFSTDPWTAASYENVCCAIPAVPPAVSACGPRTTASKFNVPTAQMMSLLRVAYYSIVRGPKMTDRHAAVSGLDSCSSADDDTSERKERAVLAGINGSNDPLTRTSDVSELISEAVPAVQQGGSSPAARSEVDPDTKLHRRAASALQSLSAALGMHVYRQECPSEQLTYGVASCRGWRVAMEDAYAVSVPLGQPGHALFTVCDGHGGAEVARYGALHLGRELLAAADRLGPSAPAHGPGGPQDSPSDNDMQEDAQADGSPAGPRRRSSTNNHMTSEASPDASNSGAGDPASSPQSQTAWTPAAAGTSPVPYPRSLPLPRPLSPATAARALHEAFLEVDGQLGEEERLEQLRALANTEAGAGQDAGSAGTARPAAASQAYGRRSPGGPFVGPAAGSTATVALVGPHGVTVAGVGDSRCILGSARHGVLPLTLDHKASDAAERDRVIKAGLWVSASGRVCGELDMSRALGDADLKQAHGLPRELQAVTAQPTVMSLPLVPTTSTSCNSVENTASAYLGLGTAHEWQPSDRAGAGVVGGPPNGLPSAASGLTAPGCESPSSCSPGTSPALNHAPTYLLLASDGLWNVLDNTQVHTLVMEQLSAGVPPDAIAAQLAIESCVAERTAYDNVTVLLVLLHGREPALPPAAAATAAPTAAASTQGQCQRLGQLGDVSPPLPQSLVAAAMGGCDGSSGMPLGPVVRVHTPPPPTRFPASAGGTEGGQASLGPQQQRKRRQLHTILDLDVVEGMGLGAAGGHAGAEAGNLAAAQALYAAAFPSRANKRQVQLSDAQQQQQQQGALGLGLGSSGAAVACTAATPAHGPEASAGAAGRAAGIGGLGGSCWRPTDVSWVAGSGLGSEGRLGEGGIQSAVGVLGAEAVAGGPDAGAAGTGLDDRLLEASPLHGAEYV